MTKRQTVKQCCNCGIFFDKEFSHQKFCSTKCAFWSRVTETPAGCLEWTGSCASTGYGEFRYNGKLYRAHRYGYESKNGPIPDGMNANHICNNRKCVNPDHIYAGTQADNMDDIARTMSKSSRKLNKDQIKHIKDNIGVISMLQLSKIHGVSFTAIWAIKEGKTYKYD